MALHTFTVACLICGLELMMNYHSKLREGGYFKAEALRPVAAHCIGYPLVSIGMYDLLSLLRSEVNGVLLIGRK